jgi:hypothetical protein
LYNHRTRYQQTYYVFHISIWTYEQCVQYTELL